MAIDPIHLRVLAEKKEDENCRFRQFLKMRSDEDEVDRRVFAIARRVTERTDCTACANCCKTVRPSFSEEEIDRLAMRLGIERQRFIETYLERTDPDDDNLWQTRSTPCPFLKDNRCSVYEDRPGDCRGYPYLDQPDFTSRLWGMIERTFTCPIVYEVMEELKPQLGFRDRKRRR